MDYLKMLEKLQTETFLDSAQSGFIYQVCKEGVSITTILGTYTNLKAGIECAHKFAAMLTDSHHTIMINRIELDKEAAWELDYYKEPVSPWEPYDSPNLVYQIDRRTY